MADASKRAQRFALLEQLQKTKVDQAGRAYQATLEASSQAAEKLSGLEAYFDTDDSGHQSSVYAVNLVEISVFRSRLQTAIAAQRNVCEQLGQQSEVARRMLIKAQERCSGLGKASTTAQQKNNWETEKREQQRTEDAVIARYGCKVRGS